ncbi:spermatogenesis-associated protein 7 [Hypomesus transpacificus]|uniref:spermatogenesis-associated protein 7 n=1 Tax=Hypomesus transpacificus TaxID=137520 RepID=UPI001F0836AF|nr:spermatogenesis-associated protein 7 [Hypomesus transpacificus]
MGYVACIMDSKRVNAWPVPVNQSAPRGEMILKSSPFCPRSSSRLTQYIIQDHMVSHYKKVYSAKAAIDASVPKSMLHSVKYHDQLRRDQLMREGSRCERRPQSAHSLSQRSSRTGTRASCVSQNAQGRRSVQGQESAYFCLESSSPRLNTSFHAKQIVYPSHSSFGPGSPSQNVYSASEISYRGPNSPRQHSAHYGTSTGTQSGYKAFQDPAQKTYSGDLLQKHAHHFTQDKPFTPRTLKSDSRSHMSQYRYYTPPRRKTSQNSTGPQMIRQETYHGSTHAHKDFLSTDLDDPPQGFCAEREWSDDDSHAFDPSAFGHQNKEFKSRNSDLHLSSYRVSPEGMKSPILKRVSAEEEELMYLEFIADVTNEILSRGLYSDRVLERVFERHVEINKLRLDEDKMRHLLEVLQNDLQSPANTPTCSTEPKSSEHNLLHHWHRKSPDTEVSFDTKEDTDTLPYASFNEGHHEKPDRSLPLSMSTPLHRISPERTGDCSSEEAVQEPDEQHNNKQEHESSLAEEASHSLTNNEDHISQNPAVHDDGVSRELEELGRNIAESLCVTSNSNNDSQDVTEPANKVPSLSDDDF